MDDKYRSLDAVGKTEFWQNLPSNFRVHVSFKRITEEQYTIGVHTRTRRESENGYYFDSPDGGVFFQGRTMSALYRKWSRLA